MRAYVRTLGRCDVEARGYLYGISSEQLPIAEIVGVGVETLTSTNRVQRTPVTTWQRDIVLRRGDRSAQHEARLDGQRITCFNVSRWRG